MATYFGQWPTLELIRQRDGARVRATEALKGSTYLLIFFGAGWSVACRQFAPKLRAFYDAHHADKSFEVICILRDATQEEMEDTFFSWRRPGPADSPAREGASGGGAPRPRSSSDEGFYLLPFEQRETVAAPLLYRFRVFSYPAALVFDNLYTHPAVARPRTTKQVAGCGPDSSAGAPPLTLEGPLRIERDSKGRRKFTPPMPGGRTRCPRLLSLTGRYMIEELDPAGDQFPWTELSAEMKRRRMVFLSLVGLLLAAVCYGIVQYLIPILLAQERRKAELRRARAARLAGGPTEAAR